jgi:hypothetical protein
MPISITKALHSSIAALNTEIWSFQKGRKGEKKCPCPRGIPGCFLGGWAGLPDAENIKVLLTMM